MRTTVDIEDSLLVRLRHEAVRRGVAFKHLLNRLLLDGLEGKHEPPSRPYRCPSFSMGTPSVDLDKALGVSAALEDDAVTRELEARK